MVSVNKNKLMLETIKGTISSVVYSANDLKFDRETHVFSENKLSGIVKNTLGIKIKVFKT